MLISFYTFINWNVNYILSNQKVNLKSIVHKLKSKYQLAYSNLKSKFEINVFFFKSLYIYILKIMFLSINVNHTYILIVPLQLITITNKDNIFLFSWVNVFCYLCMWSNRHSLHNYNFIIVILMSVLPSLNHCSYPYWLM